MPSAIAYYNRKRSPQARPTGETLGQFNERIRAAEAAGYVRFAPWLDPHKGETAEMRKAYPLMVNSPVVKPALLSKLYAIASLDLQTTPAADTEQDQIIADFVRYAYTEALELYGLVETIFLPGWTHGESINEAVPGEQVWDRGKWRGKRFYRAVKTKENAKLKYDKFRNVVAVCGPDENGETVEYDPQGFIIFQHLPMFGGPGISDLRAAYYSWWMRDTIEKLHAIHLEKFTSPYLMATYSEDLGDKQAVVEGELEKAKSRMWGLFPESIKVQAMALATRGEAEFLAKTKDLEEKIVLSITGAFLTMLTSNTVGDIRGSSGTQKSSAELFIWAGAAKFCSLLNRQATPWLVRENFGPQFDYPKVNLGGINYADLAAGLNMEKLAQDMGFRLSKKAFGKKYNLQEATDDADVLKPEVAAPVGPFGFSEARKQECGCDVGDETHAFCGGKGGKPGPCPTGRKADPHATKTAAKDLYERIATGTVDYPHIRETVAQLGTLPKADLLEVAKSVDVTAGSYLSKGAILGQIQQSMEGRLENLQRTGRNPVGPAPTAAPAATPPPQAKATPKATPAPKATPKAKPANVKIAAAADKVAKINAKVDAAKATLEKHKVALKAAKVDLAAVKREAAAKAKAALKARKK